MVVPSDWLHGVAPRYLGISIVTLSTPQAQLVITPCSRLRLTSISRCVIILWSYKCSGCWLLSINKESQLSARCRLGRIGDLDGSYPSSGSIISTSACISGQADCMPEQGWSNWSSITCGRLSIRSCISCLPLCHSGPSLGIADISGLFIGS